MKTLSLRLLARCQVAIWALHEPDPEPTLELLRDKIFEAIAVWIRLTPLDWTP